MTEMVVSIFLVVVLMVGFFLLHELTHIWALKKIKVGAEGIGFHPLIFYVIFGRSWVNASFKERAFALLSPLWLSVVCFIVMSWVFPFLWFVWLLFFTLFHLFDFISVFRKPTVSSVKEIKKMSRWKRGFIIEFKRSGLGEGK